MPTATRMFLFSKGRGISQQGWKTKLMVILWAGKALQLVSVKKVGMLPCSSSAISPSYSHRPLEERSSRGRNENKCRLQAGATGDPLHQALFLICVALSGDFSSPAHRGCNAPWSESCCLKTGPLIPAEKQMVASS